jgi:hypothetical protein
VLSLVPFGTSGRPDPRPQPRENADFLPGYFFVTGGAGEGMTGRGGDWEKGRLLFPLQKSVISSNRFRKGTPHKVLILIPW